LIRKTSITPKPRLEEHLMWEDIAILNRYLLMLSFNDSLDGKIFFYNKLLWFDELPEKDI
jgi:hypothetical protein